MFDFLWEHIASTLYKSFTIHRPHFHNLITQKPPVLQILVKFIFWLFLDLQFLYFNSKILLKVQESQPLIQILIVLGFILITRQLRAFKIKEFNLFLYKIPQGILTAQATKLCFCSLVSYFYKPKSSKLWELKTKIHIPIPLTLMIFILWLHSTWAL